MTQKKRRVLKKKASGSRRRSSRTRPEPAETPSDQVWKGNPKLEPWLVPIDDVKPNPKNTRRHAQKDVDATAASMVDHGQQWPVLVQPEDMVLLAGEGRWLAAKKLGWTHVAALASDIAESDERSLFSLRDNRTAELSDWSVPDLSLLLKDLSQQFDIPATGLWEDYELGSMINADLAPPEPGSADEPSEGGGGDEKPDMGAPLLLTVEQREVVDRAVGSVREHEGYEDISDGRAVELICGDFLAGPSP